MYIHVPTAWLSTFIYGVMALASLGTLVWRHPLADAAQKAAAPIGAVFTFVCLVTGSLWGKPMWGTYWVWDARLTSVLVLFILYLGLIALSRSIDDPGKAARATAILTLVGTVNLPITSFPSTGGTAAPARLGFPHGRPHDRPELLWPLMRDGAGLHLPVPVPASDVDKERDFAPTHRAAHHDRGGRRRRAGKTR